MLRKVNHSLYWPWRKAILERDKHKCQFPNCRARTKLEIHHIIRWVDAPQLRYEIGNGITLCRKHHKSIKNKENFYIDLFLGIVRGT